MIKHEQILKPLWLTPRKNQEMMLVITFKPKIKIEIRD